MTGHGWSHRQLLLQKVSNINSYLSSLGESIWLGAQRHESNPSEFGWNDGSSWSYPIWLAGEPNNYNGYEGCLESIEKVWNYLSCQNSKAFVCQQIQEIVDYKTYI